MKTLSAFSDPSPSTLINMLQQKQKIEQEIEQEVRQVVVQEIEE
jgi:hypothetical protein